MPVADLSPLDPAIPVDTPRGMAVSPGALGEPAPADADWSVGRLAAAQLRQENSIGSWLASEQRHREVNDGLDPWAEIKGTPYEQHFDSFADVFNRADFEGVKRQIDRETEDRKTIAAAPAWASIPLGMTSGVLDWPTLLPGGAFVRAGKGGFSAAKSALSVGTAAGVGVTVQELGLHASQELRTPEESAVNISAGVLIGGLLGGAGAKLLSDAEWISATRNLDADIAAPAAADDMLGAATANPSSLGAAALGNKTLDEMTISGTVAGRVAKATAWANPGQRLMQSPNEAARETALNLFDMTQYLRGNREGIASPQSVEKLRQEWNSGLMQAIEADNAAYKAYRQRVGKEAMKRTQFEDEVGRAGFRGDKHEIPEIAQSAQAWRKNVGDPLRDAAANTPTRTGETMLPEGITVDTATSYFSRVPNRMKMQADEAGFKDAVASWVHRSAGRWRQEFEAEMAAKLSDAQAKAAKGTVEAKRALRDLEIEIRNERDAKFGDDAWTQQRAREVADEVFDKYMGKWDPEPGQIRPEQFKVGARGPLKGRTFNMPDELLEPWMEHNATNIWTRYHRIMATDIEMTRKFGDPLMTEPLEKVKARYDELRKGETDPDKLRKLNEREKADMRDLEGVRDLLRHTYPTSQAGREWGHIARIANSLNYVRLMGQVMLSSLPEAPRAAMVHGLRPFVTESFSALRNLKALKMSANEAKLAGNISDRVLASRLATIADIADTYTSKGPVEKFMDNMTNVASSWNGIRLWTDGVRSISTVVSQNRILRTVTNWDKAGKKDRDLLNFLGVDQAMAERIAKQFDQHGETIDKVMGAGTERWTDDVAQRAFRFALNKDLDSLVVTRSVADVPLMANTPLGRVIFQFNTFNLASHQRVLLRGLQEGPQRFIGGVVALTSMGMLGTYLAAVAGNRVDKLPDFAENPGWWIGEGLDRSGIFMMPFMLANAAEKLSGINPIRRPMQAFDEGRQGSDRVRARNRASIFGPSSGLASDVLDLPGIAHAAVSSDVEVTPGQRNTMERLIPFQSYAGMRQMLRYIVNPPNE
jgi:hypothetical protein